MIVAPEKRLRGHIVVHTSKINTMSDRLRKRHEFPINSNYLSVDMKSALRYIGYMMKGYWYMENFGIVHNYILKVNFVDQDSLLVHLRGGFRGLFTCLHPLNVQACPP